MPLLNAVRQEILGFLGVNLRQDRLSLADEELAKAINADLFSQPGTITLRLGRSLLFTTALADLVIRRIARVKDRRYYVAGTTVYREQTSILTGFSSEMTTIAPYRPFNDEAIWAFIADGNVMRKDDGTNTFRWGIEAPTATPTAEVGSGGQLTGEYKVVYTYVRKSAGVTTVDTGLETSIEEKPVRSKTGDRGKSMNRSGPGGESGEHSRGRVVGSAVLGGSILHESNPSPESAAVTLTADGLTISNLVASSDPQVTHKRIYRTLAGGVSFFFDQEVENDVLSATSTKADTALGSEVAIDQDVPPPCGWVTIHQDSALLCRDPANPHYLWYSKRYRPEAVPTDFFVEVGLPDDPLQCAVSNFGALGVFSERTKYRVIGNVTTGFYPVESPDRRGTPAPLTAIGTEFGVPFVARDGVFVTNFASPDTPLADRILTLFYGETRAEMEPINWSAVATMSAASYKGRYYWAYASGANTTPDRLAVYARETQRWYFYDHPMRSLFADETTEALLGGGVDGKVYQLESGTDDAGTAISLDVQTKDYYGGSRTGRKLFRYLRVDAEMLTGTLTAQVFLDGTAVTPTMSVTGTRTKTLLPMPEAAMGYSWRVKLTYTGRERIRVHGVSMLWLPLESA